MNEVKKELVVGNKIPDFTALSSVGPLNFKNWVKDHWTILFLKPCSFSNNFDDNLFIAKNRMFLNHKKIRLIAFANSFFESNQWGKNITQTSIPLSNPIIYDIDKMLSKKFTGSENEAYLESMNRFYIVDNNSLIRQIITFQKEVSIDLNDIYMVINSLRDTSFHKVLRE